MAIKSSKNVDILYIRRIGFTGSFLLTGITLMNLFADTGTYDYPLPRVILAAALLALAIFSYFKKWVQDNGMKVLYLIFFIYNFYGIALVAINQFQPIDTSATIIIGFALCAIIKDKRYLNSFIVFLLVTYLGFYFTAESA